MKQAGILLFILAIAGSAWSQPAVSGIVRESETRNPLGGATVQVEGTVFFAVTDEWGRFRMDKVPAGRVVLIVRYAGYAPWRDTLSVDGEVSLEVMLRQEATLMGEVIVQATRSDEQSPATFLTLNRSALQKQNFGQDLPFALSWTPSLVATSDAGTGIGYTGFRIRGSDPTRTNVTVNGLPLNDSESQAVYWVNMPDFLSSVHSVQVQRGVGTSTNGAGAFGATVNLQTLSYRPEPYAEIQMGAGSFYSRRITAQWGTGLLGKWSFDGRLSKIRSDGYVDRATANLGAYYVSGGYFGKRTQVQMVAFGGHEITYQAWYGVDRATMAASRTFNYAGAIYDSTGQVTRYYGDEVDDYTQRHLQMHVYHELKSNWTLQVSGNFTLGEGFFEQYKQNQTRSGLGLSDLVIGQDTITVNDFVVRRWLDNWLSSLTFASQYRGKQFDITIGGAGSYYSPARHYGEITWAEFSGNLNPGYVYYSGISRKKDVNVYTKVDWRLASRMKAYVDLQFRGVGYTTRGVEADQRPYEIDDNFSFFNPKAGATYSLSDQDLLYASYGLAHREPTRADYLDGAGTPRAETLHNGEAGWKHRSDKLQFETNGFLMMYRDQLVFTGEINDTGYPVRANVGESFRTGIEASGTVFLGKRFVWNANAAWSINKNRMVQMDDGTGNVTEFRNTDIVLSPRWVAGSQFTFTPRLAFRLTWMSKFVDRQYLDNSQTQSLSLDPYWVNDLRANCTFDLSGTSVEVGLIVNNLLNTHYESNGYAYGGTAYLFPQAGTNFFLVLAFKI